MEEIPIDSPFIYADADKKKKFVLIGENFSVTAKEFERIRKWFDLQFFVEGELPRVDSVPTPTGGSSLTGVATPPNHVQHDPVLIRTPPKEPELPTRPVADSE